MSQEVQGMLIRLEATTAQLRQEMARADSTVAQVSGRIDRQLAAVDSAFARAGQSAFSAGNMVRNAMGAMAAGMSISSLVAQADAYATIASRLRLVTTTAAEFNAAQKAVFSIAQSSFQPLTATAELYQRIATNQKELKLTGEGVAGIVGTISKTMAISGASASSANAALIQLGQAFASGVLRGEELNSVMEQAPALAQAIAAGMGKTVGQLRALGADGKLTADAVVKALQNQQKAVEELYGKTAVTIDNSITAMGNSYTQLIGRMDQAGNASARVASAIVEVSKVIDTLTADSATTEQTFVRVSNVAETLAVIIGGRLALAAGQMVVGFAAATKASIQQAVSLATSTSAALKQAEADAAAARQAVITAKSRQADAQATLAWANAQVAAAEQKVASDRLRQQSEINNLKHVQAALVGERVLEEQRLAAQISEQGRATARTRMAEARLAEVAIIKQIQAAEVQLASTTVATSADIQAAHARKTAAVAAYGETTLAVNIAVQASETTTAAISSASKAMLLTAAAGRGLMALLTGPVGLIAMTAAVAYSFFNVGSSADSATSSLIEHNATVEDSVKQYQALSAEQQRLQKITWAEQQIQALDAASSALDDFTYKIERGIDLGPLRTEFRGMIDDVEAGRKPLDSVTAWIEQNTKLTPTFGKELAVLASEFQKNTKAADDFGKKINGVGSASSKAAASADQLKAAQAASGQTQASKDAWDKYIEQLTKTRDLLGANAAAEAAYTAAKMGATPAQAAQAKIIAEQTDVLRKYQDAVKDGDKIKQASLKAELTALYAAEDAAKAASAVQSKAYADTAIAAESSSRRQITAIEQAANFAITSAARVATGVLAPQLNLTGYGLITNGGTAPVAPTVVPKTPEERAAAATAQIFASTGSSKSSKSAGEKLIEKQAKALEEFAKKAEIAVKSSNAMADAFLTGAESVRALTIEQEIEEELLKTGAGAREKVTKAINAQHDAQDRLDVTKTIATMRTEVGWLEKEAKATLRGTAAVEAFNVEKAIKAELAGKNIAAGSKEYDQFVAITQAQLEANKALAQANKANDIVDRLNPQIKMLRDYTEEQDALNRAMALYPENAAKYQDALVRLGQEYQQNQAAASTWGQVTIAAVDRIDDAFADMWKSVLSKSGNFMDTLKNSFKQFLAEMLHLAITKPIIVQMGSALGVGGISGQSSGLLGSSSGGLDIQGLWNKVSGAYSLATSGFGQAVSSGWSAGEGFIGGVQGAFKAGAASLSSGMGALFTTSTGTMVNGVYQLGASTAPATVDLIANTVTNSATGAVTGTATGATTAASAGLSAASFVMAGIGGAIQGYLKAGVKGAVAGAGGAVAGAYAGAAIGSVIPVIGTAIGGAIGAVVGGLFGSSLFGGSWVTKDQGFSLGVQGGDLNAQQFTYQKKKGGLFSSNKKRTRYSALDPEMQSALDQTYAATLGSVIGLFDSLNVELNDGVLDGLNVASTLISTKGKTAEEVQAEIQKWFTGLGDAAVAAVSQATASGLEGFSLEALTTFVDQLYTVNTAIGNLGIKLLDVSVAGGFAVQNMATLAGGFETLTTNITSYYEGFTTDLEKSVSSLAAVRAQFAGLGVQLPSTRDAYKDLMRAQDLSTESGRRMFTVLTAGAENASAAYSILEQRQSSYYEAFYSEAENTQRSISETTELLRSLGLTLPGTRAEYRAMVEAAARDASAAGKATYDTLMSVAAQAGTAFDGLESQARALAEAAAESAQAALEAAQAFAESMDAYRNAFFTDAERAELTLSGVQQQFRAMNLVLPETREAYRQVVESLDLTTVSGQQMYAILIGAAGDAARVYDILEARSTAAAEAFAGSLSAYNSAFFTDAERAEATLSAVQQQFRAMNLALPETRETYRKVVESLDLTTASGQLMYGTLIGAAGTAAQAYDILEARSTAAAQAAQEAASKVAATLESNVTAALGSVQRAINAQKTALAEAYNAQTASLNDMSQTAQQTVSDLTSVSNNLSGALKSLRGTSDDAVTMLRAQAQTTLGNALAAVRAGKSLSSITGLADALEVISQNSTAAYVSLEAFNRDQGRAANVVSQLNAANGKQLTAAEKTQKALEAQIAQAKATYEAQVAGLDSQLTLAQAQVDALNGVDNSIVSVATAVQSLSQAISASLAIKDVNAAQQNNYDNNVALLRAVYRTVLGRDLDASGQATWTAALQNGSVTYANLMETIARGGAANGEHVLVPGFASGGMFNGGMRLVGERGPELEVTGPSRIYNAGQTAAMLKGGQGETTAAEIRELRAELKSALFAIAKYTQKAAKNTDLLPQKLEQELYP